MRVLLMVIGLCVIGACATPLSPSHSIDIAPELMEAWALVERPTPARRIVVAYVLNADGLYDFDTRTITITPQTVYRGVAMTAGVLAHELRHADGVTHDCGKLNDRRRDGAWTAHAETLERLGVAWYATEIRTQKFCQ